MQLKRLLQIQIFSQKVTISNNITFLDESIPEPYLENYLYLASISGNF